MSSIKHLQMAEAVCTFSGIKVSSSLFGLSTKAVYLPTGSPVKAETMEFSAEVGQRLQHFLLNDPAQHSSAEKNFRDMVTENGNYMLEICRSKDNAFAALQLFHYEALGYQSVTRVLFFEGQDAQAVLRLF